MKKWFLFFLLFLLLTVSSTDINADLGPKPTLEIEIIGMDEPYVLDVLIQKDAVQTLSEEDFNMMVEYNHYLGLDYPDTLNGYHDDEGFASGVIYSGPPFTLRELDDDLFRVGYYSAPENFKVILISEDGILIVSEEVERSMFKASFTFDLSGVSFDDATDVDGMDILVVEERLEEVYSGPTDSNIVNIGLGTIFRTAITLIVELVVLYFFTYRKKHTFITAGITNVITQGILSAFVVYAYYYWGGPLSAIIIFVLGEALVFLIEMIAYPMLFKEKTRKWAVLYGFVANLLSLMIGFGLIFLL